ncbi:MAG: hypothetical protein HOD49_01335 [Anaerolineae bacterium]|jgi:hypothetical protein|nr:hypothetical protein [Anaerolineae bacterium]
MSTARDSFLYNDIQDLLEKQLPEHGYPVPIILIRDILNDLFDSVALHVWSREDIIGVAKERGWPISPEATDEILENIERHVDCELGITWLTVEIAVDDFYGSIDWWELPKEKREQYKGDFVMKLEKDEDLPPSETYTFSPAVWQGDYRLLKDKTLQEVFEEAERIVKESNIPLRLYAMPPDNKPKAGVEENGKEIADFHPDYFEEEHKDE